MIGLAPVETTVEKINQLMDSEIEIMDGMAWFKKERPVKLKDKSLNMIVPLDLEVSFLLIQEGASAVNKAKISLLPEEFLPFSEALRNHYLPFPINYSQQLIKNAGNYSIFLESQEPPLNFAERLASALERIKA